MTKMKAIIEKMTEKITDLIKHFTPEFKQKYHVAKKYEKMFIKNQWYKLFSSQDFNAVQYLYQFINNDNTWVQKDNELFDLKFDERCYSDVKIIYKGEIYPLFQEDYNNIRITPLVYIDLKKNYKKFQKVTHR